LSALLIATEQGRVFMKRTAWFSRRYVDPVNSVAWFAMDGLWLAEFEWPAYIAAAVTLLTGGALLFLDRRRGEPLDADLALNAWMWMNALWTVSDLRELPALRYAAIAFSVIGAVLLVNAIRPSKRSRGRIRRLKKMRLTGR
jgi:hypothetical protein